MQIIIYDQTDRGRTNNKHKSAINSFVARYRHVRVQVVTENKRGPKEVDKSHDTEGSDKRSVKKLSYRKRHFEEIRDERTKSLSMPSESDRSCTSDRLTQRYTGFQPLSSLPFKLRPSEYKLADHYMKVLSTEYYGLPQRHDSIARFDSFRDTNFHMALQNPVLFRIVVLGISAAHIAATRGSEFGDQLQHQQCKSLKEMQVYFQKHQSDCSDTSIAICLFRAMLETCLGKAGSPLLHMRAAMSMVEKRGGYQALSHSDHLLVLLTTFSWRFARDDIKSMGQPHIIIDKSPKSPECHMPKALIDDVTIENIFIRFLADAADLSFKQRQPKYRQLMPLRHTIFVSCPYIKKMLQVGMQVTNPFHWQDGDWLNILVVLILLNRMLLDARGDIELTTLLLDDFRDRMHMLEVDGHQHIRAVTKMLAYPSSRSDVNQGHWDRLWFTGCMLRWVVRTDCEYECTVMRHLLANLTFDPVLADDDHWTAELEQKFAVAPLI